jgi:hypothetical protein
MDYNFQMNWVATFLPYVAVLLGMGFFDSAWSAKRFDGYGFPILTHAVADFAVLIGILLVLAI